MRFCDRDVFGTRIKTYYNCYSVDYDFVKFWAQYDDDGRMTAAVSRVEGDATLSTDGADTEELKAFSEAPTFGTPLADTKAWVKLDAQKRNKYLQESKAAGIPCKGTGEEREGDELKEWVLAARNTCGQDMRIAIKADKTTPYETIKEVMNSLRSIDESRYNLITTLKSGE